MSREAVVEVILGASRITAICHENPDADTLGSALALRMAAERLGKQAEVVAADPVPPSLANLPHADEVRTRPQLEPDLAIVVDGPLSRTGSVARECGEWLGRARVINIDHHVSNDGSEAAIAWVDPDAAATCEMVALLIPELGVTVDQRIATVLTAGIVQDTHTFAHPNATPRTLRVTADLVAAGAPLSAIHRSIYADKPFSTLALWGKILAGAEELRDGRIVHASMTLSMLAETGTQPVASEGFIDLLAGTRTADVTLLFKEADANEVRVSVRTSSRADAVAITSAFGGGGHARAAGCTVMAPLAEARQRVLDECERELQRADARGR
ncbi:MAG TPA: bifunctional oligoribonuclease/PAP phosphatase NrnA [Candidatus Limnocylindria bacterium]|nr:bifunctional oligoribonuclease/PAP phosphatase NrnA [Candidatus Limnocylindria bacterium]